jgi:hypothetical protein
MKEVSALAVIIVFLVLSPFALVWSINELSEQGGLSFELPYNIWTWISCVAIALVIKGPSS